MQPTVIIYSSPTCGYCHQAKDYFKDKNIDFTEKDITTDEEAFRFVVEKVGQAVTPIITIDDDIIVGYDPQQIDKLIDQHHDPASRAA